MLNLIRCQTNPLLNRVFILFLSLLSSQSIIYGLTADEQKILETFNHEKNVVFKTVEGKKVNMDIFFPDPDKIQKKNPWMLFVHGGGWAGGSKYSIFKKSFLGTLQSLVDSGVVCATVEYRLARAPATAYESVVDSKDAARFLLKNAEKYKLDKDRYGVWGGSAGGHLSLVAALGADSDFRGDPQLADFSTQFKCVASYFPLTSCVNPDLRPGSIFKNGSLFVRLLGGTVSEKPELARLLSPTELLEESSPPILLLHGENDTTLPIINSLYMMEVAEEKNADVQLLTIENAGHSFRGSNISPSIEGLNDYSANFILSHLKETNVSLHFKNSTVSQDRPNVIFVMPDGHAAQENARTRLIILADMGCEPDEIQQMIHMVMCSNEFEPEGLIAVTGKYIRPGMKNEYHRITHPELFTEIIDAYAEVVENLKKHATGWHTPEYFHSIVCTGQAGYGIEDVGGGKSSAGSKLLEKAFEKDDARPIWIVVNAGSNTLAQALYDYEKTHSKLELKKTIDKLRVFENGAQDNAGAYICNRYPTIHWIRSNYQTYAYGGPKSPAGSHELEIGPHFWGEYEYSYVGQNDWLIENVMKNHGPLGAVYPERRWGERFGFMEGGGTIPWIGLANRGLFDINHPSWGGWGGRYSEQKVRDVWSRHQSVRVDDEKHSPFYTHSDISDVWYNQKDNKTYPGDYVPVWRWREAMYNDFKCRMDWCTQPFGKANHHPKAIFIKDDGDDIISITAIPGEKIELDASLSTDPDNDKLEYSWWVYDEAGSYSGKVYIDQPSNDKTFMVVPSGAANKEIHLIMEIKDKNPIASLFDYRRIIINVSGS